MNPAPFEQPIAEVPKGVFTIPWKMWLGLVGTLLNGVQQANSYTIGTPATGGTIQADDASGILIIQPAGELASLTVGMPANPSDGMRWIVLSTYTVIAFTLTSLATIENPPTSLIAGVGIGYTYAKSTATWYRLY